MLDAPTPDFAQPVRAFARPTAVLRLDDSLGHAAQELRRNGAPLVPIIEDGRLAGAVTEASLLAAFSSGAGPTDTLASALAKAPTIAGYLTASEALRTLEDGPAWLVVVDDEARPLGLLAPSDLFGHAPMDVRPPTVGGMATPLGVYLTTGNVQAGAGRFALALTGFAMFFVLAVATIAAEYASGYAQLRGLSEGRAEAVGTGIWIVLFFGTFRFSPIAGIHAAEHKVVHAIERGEPLTPETVRRMPRVHPRCGTNLAVGLTLLIGLATLKLPPPLKDQPELQFIFALIVTAFVWRPLGNLAQALITTKPPKDYQIAMGIRSGKELLERYAHARVAMPTLGQRLFNSGLPFVMLGSLTAYGLVKGALWLFGLGDLI
ncbi:MAG: DUF1385 domain-containing protein [Fimbriimonas ginsengisoli]|uniref:DUF1385 domain-containing protein n=1 Tax=Fimbriimonas ginsengisoli TaxID=1005039 RepID=A0A931PTI7_FIMGI|nr:DUF1385 domain-containing protein [Fimbriimonas ginsengisoli]